MRAWKIFRNNTGPRHHFKTPKILFLPLPQSVPLLLPLLISFYFNCRCCLLPLLLPLLLLLSLRSLVIYFFAYHFNFNTLFGIHLHPSNTYLQSFYRLLRSEECIFDVIAKYSGPNSLYYYFRLL